MPTCCRAYSGPPSCCWQRTRTALPRAPPAGSRPASATAGWAEADSLHLVEPRQQPAQLRGRCPALGIEGLGPLTPKASSLLVMAIVGGAVIPLLQGVLADRIGVQLAFVLPMLCYAYIAWYALQGSGQRLGRSPLRLERT